MYISMNWIKDFVDLNGLNDDELINKFTMSTAEVESIIHYGENTKGVVVGKILAVEDVPDSKKLHKVTVDIGSKKIQSICGAPNVAVNETIAFAPFGSMVQGVEIKSSKLAGLDSNGVCLSEKELGISDNHEGIMILDDSLVAGTDIKSIIPIDDTVFEIDNKSLTNRPDLWGHYGIAREFSAITGRKLKELEVEDLEKYNSLPKVDVKVKSDKCYRYSSITVENVTKKISGLKMRTRLYYCGSRAINLLADITNYIMMELGQPMHAFDKSLVSNIVVKTLDKDTLFTTLDSNVRKIDKDTLMICDSIKPIAIAGIMGGENTEIKDTTNSLLLESATFDTVCIRKSSTRLGLKTDSSQRYEKTLDPELTKTAVARYLKLLKDTDKNVKITSSFTDVYNKKYDKLEIDLDSEYISKRIGEIIPNDFITTTLKSLGFEVTDKNNRFHIIVPSYRATKDITNKADIVEEVARIYGYDKITPKTTLFPLLPVKEDRFHKAEYETKRLLAEKFGLNEVHSYIWYNTKQNMDLHIETEDNIKIINALNAEDSTLRNSIIPALLCMTDNNLKNFDSCNIFEIGRVFDYKFDNSPVNEKKVLGIVLSKINGNDEELLFNMKKITEAITKLNNNIQIEYWDNDILNNSWMHPVNSFILKYNNIVLGYISILHPIIKNEINKKASIVISEIYMDELNKIEKVDKVYKKYTKQQTVDIDLSLITLNTYKYSNIEKLINTSNIKYLINYKLVDIFEDELKLGNKKSITIRFTLGDIDKTLTGEEINKSMDELIELFEANGIEIRK